MTDVLSVGLFYLLFPILIIVGFNRWKWIRKLGVVFVAYLFGILLSLSGFTSFEENTEQAFCFTRLQSVLMSLSVSLAIPLMLFKCDFKLWIQALPKSSWSLFWGILSVIIASFSGYFLFDSCKILEFDNVVSMMTGIYVGGTLNFNALGIAFRTDKTIMTILLAFEMIITTLYLLFIISGGYKLFRRLLPQKEDLSNDVLNERIAIEIGETENYSGLLSKENFVGLLKGFLLSLLFLILSAGISLALCDTINEFVIILSITTLSILASFSQKVRSLPKTFELGMFFILIFSIVVASLFNYIPLGKGTMFMGLFVLWMLFVSSTLHLIFCKIFKIEGDLFTITQVALYCSPPFVPPVVGVLKNRKVFISGIAMGLVGYAIGTYLGGMMKAILSLV